MVRPAFLNGFAHFVVLSSFVLLLAGGQVTSTDSGDAVPTWPLPLRLAMSGGVFFELGHRQIAGAVGLLTLFLSAWLWCQRRVVPRDAVRMGGVAALLVLVQAALGGGRVLLGTHFQSDQASLVTTIAVAHALLGQIFFCSTVLVAYRLGAGRGFGATHPQAPAAFRKLASAARMSRDVVFLQLLLGALLRLTRPGPVPLLLGIHLLGALLVLYALSEVFFRARSGGHPTIPFVRPATWLLVLLGCQIGLGFAAFFAVKGDGSPAAAEFNWRTVTPTLHLALGALILAGATVLREALRRPAAAPPGVPAAGGGLAA
jgi:heme A synthase